MFSFAMLGPKSKVKSFMKEIVGAWAGKASLDPLCLRLISVQIYDRPQTSCKEIQPNTTKNNQPATF